MYSINHQTSVRWTLPFVSLQHREAGDKAYGDKNTGKFVDLATVYAFRHDSILEVKIMATRARRPDIFRLTILFTQRSD